MPLREVALDTATRTEHVFATARLSLGYALAARQHFARPAALRNHWNPRQTRLSEMWHGLCVTQRPAVARPAHPSSPYARTGCTPGTHVSRPLVPIRNQLGHRPEDIMFIYLFLLLRKALERAEHSRRDAYLASAVDIGELERRMHSMDVNG
jgi:Protein of unknown function (DUF3563)